MRRGKDEQNVRSTCKNHAHKASYSPPGILCTRAPHLNTNGPAKVYKRKAENVGGPRRRRQLDNDRVRRRNERRFERRLELRVGRRILDRGICKRGGMQ
jgi:hypothetical protein